jgi:hypothetical protein
MLAQCSLFFITPTTGNLIALKRYSGCVDVNGPSFLVGGDTRSIDYGDF